MSTKTTEKPKVKKKKTPIRQPKLKRTSQRFGEQDPLAPHVRKKRMEIRFHNHEFLKIVDAFEKSGQYQNLAQYVRENILDLADGGKRSITRNEVQATFADVYQQLRKIGTNINQIAKRLNQGDAPGTVIFEMKTALAQISETCVRLLKKSNGINTPTEKKEDEA